MSNQQGQPRKYITYDCLLSSGLAVRHDRNFVYFSTAGDGPIERRLVCATKRRAKKVAAVVFNEVRRARSNGEYNELMAQAIGRLVGEAETWPTNEKTEHVHDCARGRSGQPCAPNETGITPCGFDWTGHEMNEECRCAVEIDATDESGELRFVVHKDFAKKGQIVFV